MEIAIIAALSSLFGVSVGGIISYQLQKARFRQDLVLQKERFEHELSLLKEENKTDNVAEETIRYYLADEGHLMRSFKHLSTKIAGFEEDELRRLLVRAGAVRFLRNEDKEEMWCLVKNLPEFYAKEKEKRNKKK
jgi:hypothetical protein